MATTVKINAGKILYDEDTKKCTPLPHRGVITVEPNAIEESFFNFTWNPKSTSSGNVEADDFVIIPGDITFKKVKSCKTGRVVALTFMSSGAKNLYWLQDVGDEDELNKFTDKDDSAIKKINDLVYEPEDEIEATEESNEDVKMEDTQSTSASGNTIKFPIYSISDVLTPELVSKHLQNLTPEQLQQLYGDSLPEGTRATHDDIMDVVRSTFFQQSEQKFSSQLREGTGIGAVLAQTLKYEYPGEGVEGFLKGVRSTNDKGKDGDSDMEEEK